MRRYSLAYSQNITTALVFAVFMLVAGGWTIFEASGTDLPRWWLFTFWMLWSSFLLFFAFRTLTSVRAIIVHNNDEIEFVSALDREQLSASHIQSIKVLKGEAQQIVVYHSSGTIYLAGPMNDFHQFLAELKLANPTVVLVGC